MNKTKLEGENLRFFQSKSNKKLLVGGTGVGKSYTGMLYVHLFCVKHPGVKVLLCRKSLPALRNSLVKTYEQILKETGFKDKVRVLGETRPCNFLYDNSINEVNGEVFSGTSEIMTGAIDSFRKHIGTEYDLIYIHEPVSEGLTLNEFLLITSRARGSNASYPQVIAEGGLPVEKDSERNHWLWTLPEHGFEVFNPKLRDNPLMYDFTDMGKEYINQLNRLPEHLKKVELDGEWK